MLKFYTYRHQIQIAKIKILENSSLRQIIVFLEIWKDDRKKLDLGEKKTWEDDLRMSGMRR